MPRLAGVENWAIGVRRNRPSQWCCLCTSREGMRLTLSFKFSWNLCTYIHDKTGYGKENIGRNSKFLQGPMTEGYMVEEIVESLRHADPLFCKLQNHKPDGSVYQLLLCLTPVFNVDGEGQECV